jgi:Ca2+-binding EF-hand superfamily protein
LGLRRNSWVVSGRSRRRNLKNSALRHKNPRWFFGGCVTLRSGKYWNSERGADAFLAAAPSLFSKNHEEAVMRGGKSFRDGRRGRVLTHEILESRSLLAGLTAASPWHNAAAACDVNSDGAVSPMDALVDINALNAGLGGDLAGKMAAGATSNSYVDTDDDGALSPFDALLIINLLNAKGAAASPPAAATGPQNSPPEDDPITTTSEEETEPTCDHDSSTDEESRGDVSNGDDDEAEPHMPPKPLAPADLFAKLDVDADGGLMFEEFEALPPPPHSNETPDEVFAKLDADGDSSVTLQEFTAGLVKPFGPPPGDQHGDHPPRPGNHSKPGSPSPTPEELLGNLDADGDSSLSLTELESIAKSDDDKAAIDEMFANWDTDASGLLSLDEFSAGLATLHHKPPAGS